MKELTVNDIQVPEGMLKAVDSRLHTVTTSVIEMGLREALLWLAHNPIVPSDDELARALKDSGRFDLKARWVQEDIPVAIEEWQRHMFLKPEPVVPEEVKALLFEDGRWIEGQTQEMNRRISTAYELGRKASM